MDRQSGESAAQQQASNSLRPTGEQPSPSAVAANCQGRAASQRDDPIDRRWFILVLLFAGLGPLAIPFLWRSRAFGRAGKLALTIAVLVATAAVIWIGWLTVIWFVQALRDAGLL